MYAVIQSGGKQYRVAPGQHLKIEKLEAQPGDTINFEQVMMLADGDKCKVGTPTVKGAKVSAEVIEHGRHKKIHILKFKRRKHSMKQRGHRQYYTEVQIKDIVDK